MKQRSAQDSLTCSTVSSCFNSVAEWVDDCNTHSKQGRKVCGALSFAATSCGRQHNAQQIVGIKPAYDISPYTFVPSRACMHACVQCACVCVCDNGEDDALHCRPRTQTLTMGKRTPEIAASHLTVLEHSTF